MRHRSTCYAPLRTTDQERMRQKYFSVCVYVLCVCVFVCVRICAQTHLIPPYLSINFFSVSLSVYLFLKRLMCVCV